MHWPLGLSKHARLVASALIAPRARYAEPWVHRRSLTHLYGGEGGREPYHEQSAPWLMRKVHIACEAPAQRLSLPAQALFDEPAPQKQSTPLACHASH